MWTDPITSKLQLLQVNQGLYMQHILDHTLANPNQCGSFVVSWYNDAWDKHRSLGIKCEDLDLSIPFEMERSTALFRTQTPTEDEIRDHFNDLIILTNSNTWDPVGLATPRTINATSNTYAVHKMIGKVPVEGLRVCATMEQDSGYIYR